MEQAERRKHRRFPLQQPVMLRYENGGVHEQPADAINASLTGMFLMVGEDVPRDVPVSVTLRLEREGLRGVILRATGMVMRKDRHSPGLLGIAIAFQRPLS